MTSNTTGGIVTAEDTYSRVDSTDLGVTEVGGFAYLEAGTTNSAADSADILGEQLRLHGDGGVGSSNPGVALVDADLADVEISADVRFTYPNGIANASTYNNGGFLLRRNGTTAGFGAGNEGQIEVSMQAGGGLFVREISGGSLNNLYFDNPFGLGGSTDNNYSGAGQLPAVVNGLPFDANGNGVLEESEPFRLGASLAGNGLSILVNGMEIVNVTTSASAPSADRATAGFYKNRWTSGGTRDVMSPVFDNLMLDGVQFRPPEPPPIRHVGDNDPVGEAWALSTNGAVANNGPVDDGGIAAWNINDDGGTRAGWTRSLTTEQVAAANAKGWSMEGRLRVLGADDTPDGAIELSVFTDSNVGYALWLGADSAGNAVVAEFGGEQASGLALGRSVVLDSDGYHDYKMVFDPASQTVDVFVDGALTIDDMLPLELTSTVINRILWGSNASGGIGNANYSFVEFRIVPEPAGLWTAVISLLLVVRPRVSWSHSSID